MTATAVERPQAGTPAAPSCDRCGEVVASKVPDRNGVLIALAGRDPDGPWWATRFGEVWKVVRPDRGESTPEVAWRYREHRCPPAAPVPAARAAGPVTRSTVERALLRSGFFFAVEDRPVHLAEPGPCAGHCGTMVEAYGPGATFMCEPCREVLEVWRRRARAGEAVGSIPYGRLVDGVYVPRTPTP